MIAVSKVFSDATWGLSMILHVGDDDNFSSSVSSFKGVWKVYANIMVEYFLFPFMKCHYSWSKSVNLLKY